MTNYKISSLLPSAKALVSGQILAKASETNTRMAFAGSNVNGMKQLYGTENVEQQ